MNHIKQTQIHSRERRGRTYYYCYLNGRQRGLGYDSLAEAKEILRRLMGGRAPRKSPTFAKEAMRFDAWGRKFTAARTAEDYRYWLERLVGHVGFQLRLLDIRPSHIESFVAANGLIDTWSHIKVIRSVVRLLEWSKNQGHVKFRRSPIAGIRIPPEPESPQVLLDRRQVIYLLRTGRFRGRSRRLFQRSTAIGHVVRFILATGARPEEVRIIKSEWVNLATKTITIPWKHAKHGKRTRRDRIIRYPQRIARMIERLASRGGHLFRSARGVPWSIYALDCAFDMVRERQPALYPDGCFARSLRYTYTTWAIIAGVGIVELAMLLGHRDTSMLMKHYQKLGKMPDHLQSAAELAARRRL